MQINLVNRFLKEQIDGKKLVDLHERIRNEPERVKRLLRLNYRFSADSVQLLCDALEYVHFYWEKINKDKVQNKQS